METQNETVKDLDEKKLDAKIFDNRIAKFNTII
jgi:hypothetical protein